MVKNLRHQVVELNERKTGHSNVALLFDFMSCASPAGQIVSRSHLDMHRQQIATNRLSKFKHALIDKIYRANCLAFAIWIAT